MGQRKAGKAEETRGLTPCPALGVGLGRRLIRPTTFTVHSVARCCPSSWCVPANRAKALPRGAHTPGHSAEQQRPSPRLIRQDAPQGTEAECWSQRSAGEPARRCEGDTPTDLRHAGPRGEQKGDQPGSPAEGVLSRPQTEAVSDELLVRKPSAIRPGDRLSPLETVCTPFSIRTPGWRKQGDPDSQMSLGPSAAERLSAKGPAGSLLG